MKERLSITLDELIHQLIIVKNQYSECKNTQILMEIQKDGWDYPLSLNHFKVDVLSDSSFRELETYVFLRFLHSSPVKQHTFTVLMSLRKWLRKIKAAWQHIRDGDL